MQSSMVCDIMKNAKCLILFLYMIYDIAGSSLGKNPGVLSQWINQLHGTGNYHINKIKIGKYTMVFTALG